MTATRRVAVYLPSLEGGGAERAMVDLANGLRSRGVAADVVVIRDDGPWRQLLSEDVELKPLKTRCSLTAFLKLVCYLHRARPDVVIANGASSIILALLARRIGPRVAVVARIPVNQTAGLANANLKWRLVRMAQTALLPGAAAVVTNSTGSSEDIVRAVPRAAPRVRTIYNPVVWSGLADQAAKPVEHSWFKDQRIPIILSVGRLHHAKGHATLMRAFALLAQQRDVRLVVLGEGAERRNLSALAHELGVADRVDLPGFHANPFPFMAQSRLFVLSSTHEGMPNVLIQAMACGTPVVSTDCPSGPREVLEDGQWGPLVPVGDPAALATAMRETMDRPPERSALIARAGEFSAEASVQAYLDLIRELSASQLARGR